MSIERFPGTPVTPEILLHKILEPEHLKTVKAVAVITLYEDGTMRAHNSRMSGNELLACGVSLKLFAEEDFRKHMIGE